MHVGTVKYFLALISAVFINISVINITLLSKRLTEYHTYIYCLVNLLEQMKIHSLRHRS